MAAAAGTRMAGLFLPDPHMTDIHGGCHCGAIRYRARIEEPVSALRCNCSICAACGFVHVIVPARDFEMLGDPADLSEYRFNTGAARHLFCRHCGIKAFYVPRSNPDGYSLNLNCIDERDQLQVTVGEFDGQNWEANAAALKHLSA